MRAARAFDPVERVADGPAEPAEPPAGRDPDPESRWGENGELTSCWSRGSPKARQGQGAPAPVRSGVGWTLAFLVLAACGAQPSGARARPDSGPTDAAADGEADGPVDGGADARDDGTTGGSFVDVTESSGVDFVSESETGIGGGVAVLDADGDGMLDLFLTSEVTSRLYLGAGTLMFHDATEQMGLGDLRGALGASAVDLEGDGDEDLLVGRLHGFSIVFNRGGSRGFEPSVAPDGLDSKQEHPCPSVAPGDVDLDGRTDLYVACWYPEGGIPNALLVQQPDGSFLDAATELGVAGDGATLAVAMSDYDDDGDLDLFEVNDFGMLLSGNELYRNDGQRFTRVSDETGFYIEIYGMGVAPLDFDDDGDLDYYLTNAFFNVLMRNDGARFTDVARSVGAGAYGFVDLTQVFYAFRDPETNPMVGDPRRLRQFLDDYTDDESRELGLTSFAPVVFDYDQDGFEDIYIANGFVGLVPMMPEGQRQPNVLLHAKGDGTFEDVAGALGAADRGEGRGAAHADLDGDGDQDLVVVNNAFVMPERSRVRIYRNDAAVGRSLRVRARLADGLRDALGARVRIDVGGRVQQREIGCSEYASCSERIAHFGIGEATGVDRLLVRFPSGRDVELEHVLAGEIEIIEPDP